MLAKNRSLRLILFAIPALALAAAALFLTLGPGSGQRVQAGTGINFTMGVDFNADGTNDCGTGVPSAVGDGAPDAATSDVSNATCNVPAAGGMIQVNVYLMSLGSLTAYSGDAAQVYYEGLTSPGRGSTLWTCHVFDVTAPPTGITAPYENAGSTTGVSAPCNVPQTNLGLMNRFSFTCAASGTLRLGHAEGETLLLDDGLGQHYEAGDEDTLTVNCGGGGGATDTPMPTTGATNTPVGPTNTPVGPTNTPGPTTPPPTTGPTNTPTRTNTPMATNTPRPTTVVSRCDVNGDGRITSEDGLWILWKEADIVDHVPLPENADCNHNGQVNSIDALFALWIVGGRIPAPA